MSRRGLVLFAGASVIWGIPYLLIRVAVRHLDPAVVVWGRCAIGGLVLLPITLLRRELRPVLAAWRWLLAYTGVEIVLAWYLLSDAETRLPSSLSSLLVSAVPLAATVLAVLTGSERMNRGALVGLGVGIAGVAVLLGLDVHGVSVWPVAEVLLVAVCYACGPWIAQHRLAGVPPLGLASVSLSLAALGYLPLAIVEMPSASPGAEGIASVVTLGLVCSALGFVVFLALISDIGAHQATLITYLNPAVAVVLGAAFLGEKVGISTGLGFVMILAGCALATRSRERRGRPQEDRPATSAPGPPA